MKNSNPDFSLNVHNLPSPPTSFIGREQDVAEVLRLLTNRDCRLLTLVGPGGIGKTRLAIQVANAFGQASVCDIYFTPLQAVNTIELLTSAMADALKLPLSGPDTPQRQLLNYLRDKTPLLVLDNFEQLLKPGGGFFLADILKIAPLVKLLITSREVLNLQEEWLYPVQGLPYPHTADNTGASTTYDAVQLFVERARRVRPDFSLADEQASVTRICRLVQGMPLALELAASWAKTVPCDVIANEIERNLNFLTTSLYNVPKQHRSMQAVFDHSWTLLSQEQQQAFKRLSIFHGGFRHEAGEQVAGASLLTLSALVDKSLLRWEADGRYQVHELLRQYAAEHLVLSPDDVAQIYDSHCRYYTDFLAERTEALRGGGQRDALSEIEAELENIRAAWQWAIGQLEVEQIKKSVEPLGLFYDFRGRYQEGISAFEQALQQLDGQERTRQVSLTLALLWISVGGLYIRLGRLEEAEAVLSECQTLYHQLDLSPLPGFGTDPVLLLGIIASVRGNYNETARLAQKGFQTSKAHNHLLNRELACYLLGRAALVQGQYDLARHQFQQAYTLTQETENRWFMAYCLNELGNMARALGDYNQASQHYQTSYDLRREFDDPEGMALALNHLGEIARLQNDYQTAESLYQQSLTIYRDIGDKGGLAATLNGLGQIASAQGDYRTAQRRLREALQITTQMQFMPLVLVILVSVAELLLRTRRSVLGIELLTCTQHHPASDQETKARAQQLLTSYTSNFAPEDFAAAAQRGQSSDLQTAIAIGQTELAVPIKADATPGMEKKDATSPLIEPLTERELEVLRLIADGLTNREIAERLFVVIGTVKAHNNSIYGKLGVSSRLQAVTRAQQLNLL